MGAAVLFAGFAALFVLGGWTALGDPPKPFAKAEGFFVSGLQIQAAFIATMVAILSIIGRRRRQRYRWLIEASFPLFWRAAGGLALAALSIVFFWASARFLFALAAFPPEGWGPTRSETWWIETAMACLGASLTLAIPVLLRSAEHVGIDVLSGVLGSRGRAAVARWGSVLLALPVGWVLLAKGTPFAARAWMQAEGSQNFGIEYVFAIKTLVPLLGFLLIVAALLRAFEHASEERAA